MAPEGPGKTKAGRRRGSGDTRPMPRSGQQRSSVHSMSYARTIGARERRMINELPDIPNEHGVSERAFVEELVGTFGATLIEEKAPVRKLRRGEQPREQMTLDQVA